jgi:Flp pilus assembly protein TadG
MVVVMSVANLSRERRGVVAVEGAIVLSTLMLLLFVLLDLGLAVCRYNVLSATARNLARAAIVRGADAAPQLAAWGPNPYSGNAADSSAMATVAASWLATMNPGDVTMQLIWPDGDNQPNHRVTVQLGYNHQFLTSFLSLGNTVSLQAQSTMLISH